MQDNLGTPPDPPPGVKPVRGPATWRWIIVTGILAILIAGANWIPIPIFYAYIPGPIRDAEDLVEVGDAKTYSSEGSLYLTTVNVDVEVTLRDWVTAVIDPTRTIVMKEQVTGGSSLEELEKQQAAEMDASQRHAQEVALEALGIAEPKGQGARVIDTVDQAPAADVLKKGDVIVAVNDARVSTTCEVGRAIDQHEVGDDVELTVRRAGEKETLSLQTVRNPEDPTAPYIGVYMEDVAYEFEPGFDVEFRTGEIAGPSAGLMFALALYDRLTPDDLTKGREIAGTGTIACDGGVGAIGGIEQKIAAAETKGAEIFLTPAGNVEAAEAAADDIRVVSVSSFDDALSYLQGLE